MPFKVLKNVNTVEVKFASNGFIVEYSGDNEDNEWENVTYISQSFDEVSEIIKTFAEKNSIL